MLKRIFSYMKQYKKYAFLALFCIAVEAVLELMVPMIMADLIDTGVATGDERYIYQKGFQMVLCAAYRGFFGCRHFSKTNEFLIQNGLESIDWQIENKEQQEIKE